MSPPARSPCKLTRRALSLSVGAGAAVAIALGVNRALTGDSAASNPKRKLTVTAFPAVDQIARDALAQWRLRHPEVEVEIISRQWLDHHTAMTTALSTGLYLPDVMALEIAYVGRFARGGGLEDLLQAPFNAASLQAQFVPYAVRQATSPDGALVALPTDIGPGTLLYRQDLLQRAHVSVDELTQTWESYVAAGAKIKASTGAYLLEHARNLKDILIRAGIEPGQGLYYDRNNRVLVTSDRFVRAFELARQVRRQQLDARVSVWTNDWSEGLRRGSIATQLSGAWLAGHLSSWLAPDTKGLWRASQLPNGNWAANGGTFYAIPKKSDPANKSLAWEFIQFLTTQRDNQLQAFIHHDAFPALLSAQQDSYFEQPIPFLGGQPARLLWRDAAAHISAVAVHRQDTFADEVINTELDKVLDQDKNIPNALADAAHLLAQRANR